MQFFGFPMITVLGTIALLMIVPAIVWALVAPELGVTGTTARIVLIAVYSSGFIVYFIWDLAERRRGVDVALIAREVPPE